jgi:hypothetical protein
VNNSPTGTIVYAGTQVVGKVNGNTITAGTGVLTLAAGKTLTANNTLTLAGTDATTHTFPTTSATIARTDAAQTFTGDQTYTSNIVFNSAQASDVGLLKNTGRGYGVASDRWIGTDGSFVSWYYNVPTGGSHIFAINLTNALTVGPTGLLYTDVVTFSNYGAGAATFSAAGVISSVSDETWKTKDGIPADPDAMLKKLQPGYWFYNAEKAPIYGADRQLGFYAQNVHAAIGPEAAPKPEEGKPWGYYDRSVLAVTVMSLQKALATIEHLTAQVITLEAKCL